MKKVYFVFLVDTDKDIVIKRLTIIAKDENLALALGKAKLVADGVYNKDYTLTAAETGAEIGV